MSTTASTTIDYVNAFCQAAEDVIRELLAETPVRGKPVMQIGPSVQLQAINVGIGVTGDLGGHVNLGCDEVTAKAIASAMVGETCPELDELAISALCELANMIAGTARSHLNRNGLTSDITPPSLLTGTAITGTWHHVRAIGVPLATAQGEVVLTVGIRMNGGR